MSGLNRKPIHNMYNVCEGLGLRSGTESGLLTVHESPVQVN